MKKTIKVTLTLLTPFLLVLSIIIPSKSIDAQEGDWIISGNTVYVNDDKTYASATPHTINGREEVVFEFLSKVYTGNVNFIWGFNETLMKPKNIWLWQNYSHPSSYNSIVEDNACITLHNVNSYISLGINNYSNYTVTLGNSNNIYLFNVSFEDNKTGIYAFTTYSVSGNDYTLCGNYNKEIVVWNNQTYYDWNIWDTSFTHLNINYQNMTDWYITDNCLIVKNNLYKCKVLIERINWSVGEYSGKYWFAFKPSSETIQQSITNNHLYAMDPWFNVSWSYKKEIIIDYRQVDAALTNFPVLIKTIDADLQAHALANGSDICFVNSSETLQLNHEIEMWNSTTGELIAWVNVTSVSNTSNTTIYMYYGNPSASDQQHITSTWDSNYIMVFHMNQSSGNILDSTINGNHATPRVPYSPGPYRITAPIGYGIQFDGTGGNAEHFRLVNTSNVNWEKGFTLSAWYYAETTDEASYGLFFIYANGYHQLDVSNSGGKKLCLAAKTDAAAWKLAYSTALIDENDWNYVVGRFDKTNINAYLNGTKGTSTACTSIGDNSYLDTIGGSYDDWWGLEGGMLDEVRISITARSDSWIKTEYNNMVNSTSGGFFVIGSEVSAPGWKNISTGWITFSNVSTFNNINLGWITFNNTASFKNFNSVWLTFLNYSINITSIYPANGSNQSELYNNTVVLGLNVTSNVHFNITISTNYSGVWLDVANFTNQGPTTNHSYFILYNDSIVVNTTFYWMINVTKYNDNYVNTTGVVWFNITPSNTSSMNIYIGIALGSLAILGIFGFIMYIRRRSEEE
jgi:hypothetical protein